jgi:hypothetical protein
LWQVVLATVIRCEKSASTGFIEPKGRDSGSITYSGCKIFIAKENATAKQWDEGEENSSCKTKNGENTTKPIKSRLVWAKGKN